MIKSIQRADGLVGTSAVVVTLAQAVDMSKTMLKPKIRQSYNKNNTWKFTAILTSPTEVTLTPNQTSGSTTKAYSLEVIEFL